MNATESCGTSLSRQPIAVLFLLMFLGACSSAEPLVPGSDVYAANVSSISSRLRANTAEGACNAPPDSSRPQYIIGYGSLMQDESRQRTSPSAGPAHPIKLSGYKRGWFARGGGVGFSTTYLGVLLDPTSSFNAVIYQVESSEVTATDQREASYCRTSVALADVEMLERDYASAPHGELWIYVTRPKNLAPPDPNYPIVQSYVDIFVSGCLEQEQRFELAGFSDQCLATTVEWSEHWVNDRIYPRRPFVFQPRASQIDKLLSTHLSKLFARIRIGPEG